MILITGVTGTVGSAVLEAVRQRGVPHRALYRSVAEAAHAPAGTEAVIGDFADKDSLAAAVQDIEGVFLVCSPIPDLVQLESNVIEACKAAGIRRIVLNSALGAGDYPKSFPAWHRQVEDRLRASGLSFSILRPNSFMQNIVAYFAPSIRSEGAFYAAMGEAPVCLIDVRDVAAVAADALATGSQDGQIHELNGPEAFGYAAVAAAIRQQTGVETRFVDIPRSAQQQAMLALNMPEWQVIALLDLQEYYTGGQGGQPDGTLERLLGRPARQLDAFLQEHAAAFRAA